MLRSTPNFNTFLCSPDKDPSVAMSFFPLLEGQTVVEKTTGLPGQLSAALVREDGREGFDWHVPEPTFCLLFDLTSKKFVAERGSILARLSTGSQKVPEDHFVVNKIGM